MKRLPLILSTTLMLCLVLGVGAVIVLYAQAQAIPPNTPLEAGREWFVPKNTAGAPDRTIDDGARILASWEVSADKRLVLYASRPSGTAPLTALTVTPLGIEYNHQQLLPWHPRRGWQPAGTAGRRAVLQQGDEFYAGSLPAGFTGLSAPIATAWGFSARGSQARITWSDGAITQAPLIDNAFLQARPDPNYPQQLTQRISVTQVDILDNSGNILAQQTLPRSVIPEVRGPAPKGGPALR